MTVAPPPTGLAWRRNAARAALWLEQLWPALWPAVGVAGLALCAVLFGLSDLLPVWPRLMFPMLTAVAVGILAVRGLRQVQRPSLAAIDRRLERASGLRHRPLSVLTDQPAPTDAAGQALWQVHMDRVSRQIGRLRVGAPKPGLAARDRGPCAAGWPWRWPPG